MADGNGFHRGRVVVGEEVGEYIKGCTVFLYGAHRIRNLEKRFWAQLEL